jgi:hypothetical protein
VLNIESTIPQSLKLGVKQSLYTFQAPGSDKYPPHLNMIPLKDQTPIWEIFNTMRLLDTATLIPRIVPKQFLDWVHGDPESGTTIAELEARNYEYRKEKKDIFTDPNIGDRTDWYSDAIFAQQQFTGVNPTTITQASADWIKQFTNAAETQAGKIESKKEIFELLSSADPKSLYVQDCSYHREAFGVVADAALESDDGTRFACAPVCLFQLNPDGRLHPLAIVIDYKKSIDNSVVIFNQRLSPSDSTDSENTDWPWRYAKTCAQAADWIRHEVTVHLVNTHLVEEVVIVASHRSFPVDHPVFKLMEPHWFKTLSLNAAARNTLVPNVIVDLVGVTTTQSYNFLNDAYKRFDWEAGYIPNDLTRRGFPLNELGDPKYRNYAYARNMFQMWGVIRDFVSSMLAIYYQTDDQVAKDSAIAAWCKEMQSPDGGQIQPFPTIKTINDLTDAITMAIHIASPQHTAVNYLQNYYQSFVINKPAALFSPPPASLDDLLGYNERNLIAALPVGPNNAREWLLSSHLPHLLSFRVAQDQTLINYAASLWNLYKEKKGQEAIKDAASKFYMGLRALIEQFKQHSDEMSKGSIPYEVMDPNATAISILI